MKTSRSTPVGFSVMAGKAGALLAFAASVALAQPGAHGRPGSGGISGIVLQSSVHTALALDATQEAAWQQLQAAAETLRTSLDTSRDAVKAVIAAELAKTTPDLVAIEDALDAAREADEALIQAFRQQVIAFYSSLTATQQAVVIAAFKDHSQRAGLRGPGH